jgi:hypothetical protein
MKYEIGFSQTPKIFNEIYYHELIKFSVYNILRSLHITASKICFIPPPEIGLFFIAFHSMFCLNWRDLCEVILFWSEVKWSEVEWVMLKFLGTKLPYTHTLGWPYTEVTWL